MTLSHTPQAQLKVNLRPLWSPAAGALASLSQGFGDIVWEHIIGELQAISGSLDAQEYEMPDWMKLYSADGGYDDEPMEEERSWRDPSAHKIRSAVGRWLRDDHSRTITIQVSDRSLSQDPLLIRNDLGPNIEGQAGSELV